MEEVNEVNDFEGFRGNERRGRMLNFFEGFGEYERRGRQLNWFRGFGEGMVEDTHVGMNERRANVTVNEGARGDMHEANERRIEEANEENVGARRGEGARGRGGRARGRMFRGKRSECRLCGVTVSYANMARHERTHQVWDPGGGPHPA